MIIQRYMLVLAILNDDKTLTPVWDDDVVYEKDIHDVKVLHKKSEGYRHQNVVKALYDLKTKTLSMGVELDFYPPKLTYQKGQEVYVETRHTAYYESKVVDFKYTEYDLHIAKGKEVLKYYASAVPEGMEIDPKALYALKMWKPHYILENGVVIEWEYMLKEKVAGPIND